MDFIPLGNRNMFGGSNLLRKIGEITLMDVLLSSRNIPWLFFSKFGLNVLNSYNSKTHVIRTNFESPWGFGLHKFNCTTYCKIFEKVVFNKIYNFLLNERLLNSYQSRFHLSDFCINQLFAITHEIFEVLHCQPSLKVRWVFLGISKAFDQVWHKSLLYKLKFLTQVNFMNWLKTASQKGYRELF